MTPFVEALQGRLPGKVRADSAALDTFQTDGLTAFHERPLAVVFAETQADVVQAVRLCFESGVPFVARGSGTSLSGGAVPVAGGVVIALNKLNRILALDPRARTCVVEPGVINAQVSRAAAPYGLHYAPDPSSGPVCTIGGNVAFNSGGAHCLKYGMTANHVLGLKVVLPDGEVVHLGGASLEPAGADLAGFFVGSEGLFGIALEVTLRLLPKVERYATFLAAYKSLEAAGEAVAQIVAAGLLPGAMEIMDRLAMDAAEAAVHAGYPADAQGLLIVELEGPAEEVAAETPRLLALLKASGAYRTEVARDERERALFWKGRKSAFSAVGRLSPEYLVQDGVVPRTRLGEALAAIHALSRRYGLRVANVFHAGDGNLHPLILFDAQAGEAARAEALAGEILRLCIQMGGSITGEHGVGLEKRAYLGEQYAEADMDAMLRLRRAIDPRGVANPGKMLPGGPGPAPIGEPPARA
ncbi:FAD-binding oxidoreductase [Truepera radiovictrix]|uniref:D-lactate dehydrogenase (Cytochrome) n=1 Tax=Truepera radiovictrix (strain DSM 17093 / CIP 108686 / LMG 22925 / RQ-24) TaxID=649638 RepID=D7CY48_TRURR|nr:FAD-linked oxidase C-terminal domain-containing protein [Truepera radiovictrix]ADI14687.1 D-lactate dehydrogenase (cytochrome) [Truepera radiovictrix DSM 17093]WMT56763.1 FAD-linked oxidase C-terminal domain-containing protein [Truepera radiovictrix]